MMMMSPKFENDVAAALGRIEQKVDDLAGPRGRIAQLEDAQTRQWWITIAIAPFMTIFHSLARKFGLDV